MSKLSCWNTWISLFPCNVHHILQAFIFHTLCWKNYTLFPSCSQEKKWVHVTDLKVSIPPSSLLHVIFVHILSALFSTVVPAYTKAQKTRSLGELTVPTEELSRYEKSGNAFTVGNGKSPMHLKTESYFILYVLFLKQQSIIKMNSIS